MSLFQMVRHELSFSRSSRLVKKSPVFYGWIILAAGTLGSITGVASAIPVFGSALGPLPLGVAWDV